MGVLLSFILPLAVLAYDIKILNGTARDSSGAVVYHEKHRIRQDEKGLALKIEVEYSRPDGTNFATMTSDFSKGPWLPETTFEDRRFGMKTVLRVLDDTVEFEEFKGGKSISKNVVPRTKGMVASQGFDNFIQMNRDVLARESVNFRFGVLGSRDFFGLTGYQIRSTTSEVEYGIRASHWLARIFAGELRVVYETPSRRLRSFQGLSNIASDAGKSQNVSITYQWEDEAPRIEATAKHADRGADLPVGAPPKATQ